MIKTREDWDHVKTVAELQSGPSLQHAVETIEALREVARAAPGMFEIAEIAMPDSYFQSDSRLNRMREAQDALPDWLTDG